LGNPLSSPSSALKAAVAVSVLLLLTAFPPKPVIYRNVCFQYSPPPRSG